MRKEKLILVHVALVRVRALLEENGLAKAEHFAAYDKMNVSPASFHKGKSAQELAVMELATALDDHSKHPNLRRAITSRRDTPL